jgi:predicted nucleotidyltransferase
MQPPAPDFQGLLKLLCNHKANFIVVGGVCAVLHGAPLTTFDLDLVHERTAENLERIFSALEELGAYYRESASRRLSPTASHLSSSGHHLLMTKFGPLDLLGSIGAGHSYEDLLADTVELRVEGLVLRALSLDRLIKIKEEMATEKDKAVLPLLRRTLEEKMRY